MGGAFGVFYVSVRVALIPRYMKSIFCLFPLTKNQLHFILMLRLSTLMFTY